MNKPMNRVSGEDKESQDFENLLKRYFRLPFWLSIFAIPYCVIVHLVFTNGIPHLNIPEFWYTLYVVGAGILITIAELAGGITAIGLIFVICIETFYLSDYVNFKYKWAAVAVITTFFAYLLFFIVMPNLVGIVK